MRTLLFFVVLGASAGGCGQYPVKYALTKSTTAATTAKPAGCDFRVVNLPPNGAYEEIATLTPEDGVFRANDPVRFQAGVRDAVCRVGGDVVVTEINGSGWYVRGTVLRAVAINADQH